MNPTQIDPELYKRALTVCFFTAQSVPTLYTGSDLSAEIARRCHGDAELHSLSLAIMLACLQGGSEAQK